MPLVRQRSNRTQSPIQRPRGPHAHPPTKRGIYRSRQLFPDFRNKLWANGARDSRRIVNGQAIALSMRIINQASSDQTVDVIEWRNGLQRSAGLNSSRRSSTMAHVPHPTVSGISGQKTVSAVENPQIWVNAVEMQCCFRHVRPEESSRDHVIYWELLSGTFPQGESRKRIGSRQGSVSHLATRRQPFSNLAEIIDLYFRIRKCERSN
jgi:hypothetical protein